MLRIEVISGKSVGKCATFNQRIVRVGTAIGTDFQIQDDLASGSHGLFSTRPGHDSYIYEDMQSTHGTRVHSKQANVVLLNHNNPQQILLSCDAMVHIGRSVLRCSCEPDEPVDVRDQVSRIMSISQPEHRSPANLDEMHAIVTSLRHITSLNSLRDVFKSYVNAVFEHIPTIDRGSIWHSEDGLRIFSCIHERTARGFVGQASFGITQMRNAIKSQEASIYEVNRLLGDKTTRSNLMIIPISRDEFEDAVVIFESPQTMTRNDLEWVMELTQNAAISAARIYRNADLTDVLDGFIRSTISALDTRDPAAAGHSSRVANYVLMTAQAIHAQTDGPFAGVTFSRDEFDELRYAALLHDIGKVAVREDIVLKAGRLLPRDYAGLIERIDLFSAWYDTQSAETLGKRWRSQEQFARYHEMVVRLQHADSPIFEQDKIYLAEMADTFIPSLPNRPLLTKTEHDNLLIPYGTLNAEERSDIQQHVLISWRYLSRILWPRRWARVPAFVLQHHEKLNGTGYPYGIRGDAIFFQSRILTVCDIFDALTGGDRPYKQRHSFKEAADILNSEVSRGALDKDITALFIEQILPLIAGDDSCHSSIPFFA